MRRRKRIGEILLETGVVTEPLLSQALRRQKGRGGKLGEVLEEMGLASGRTIASALARQFGLKTALGIAGGTFSAPLLGLLPGEEALKRQVFPLKQDNKKLFLAMVNPLDLATLDYLSFRTGLGIIPCVTTPDDIREAVRKHYFMEQKEEGHDAPTILVVEDQELARATILATLDRQGFRTMAADNGADGLNAAFRELPDLIVTDILMPRMNGYDMFRLLKAEPSTRHIPVIALTARASAQEEARLLQTGFIDFVAKPINAIRLSARVKKALTMTCLKTEEGKIKSARRLPCTTNS